MPDVAATDSSTELIELSQTKTVRSIDKHGIGPWNIQTGFDNGGANQYI